MKVQVLKPFVIGKTEHLSGIVEVPDNKVARLVGKGLAAPMEAPLEASLDVNMSGYAANAGYAADYNDQLEPIAARISAALGVERFSDQTPLQFLKKFAGDCESVAQKLEDRLDEQKTQFDASWKQAQGEIATLTQERDEAIAERDKLRTELDELKARQASAPAASKTAPKADGKKAE